jgi:hypothetical protein
MLDRRIGVDQIEAVGVEFGKRARVARVDREAAGRRCRLRLGIDDCHRDVAGSKVVLRENAPVAFPPAEVDDAHRALFGSDAVDDFADYAPPRGTEPETERIRILVVDQPGKRAQADASISTTPDWSRLIEPATAGEYREFLSFEAPAAKAVRNPLSPIDTGPAARHTLGRH